MTIFGLNTHLRDRPHFADWFAWLRPNGSKSAPLPKSISDHLARDIGLDDAELERLRLEWPSRSNRPTI